jgi:hypothetical protein
VDLSRQIEERERMSASFFADVREGCGIVCLPEQSLDRTMQLRKVFPEEDMKNHEFLHIDMERGNHMIPDPPLHPSLEIHPPS